MRFFQQVSNYRGDEDPRLWTRHALYPSGMVRRPWDAASSSGRHRLTARLAPLCLVIPIAMTTVCHNETAARKPHVSASSPRGSSPPPASPTPTPTVSERFKAPATTVDRATQAEASRRLHRLTPIKFAFNDKGLLLVTYLSGRDIEETAWRLFNRRNKVVTTAPDAYDAVPAGKGFLLSSPHGYDYIDPAGGVTRIVSRDFSKRPFAAGDIAVDGRGLLRLSDSTLTKGTAVPDGLWHVVDARHRMLALAPRRSAHGRTVIRYTVPGRQWHSRDHRPSHRRTVHRACGSLVAHSRTQRGVRELRSRP